jgi:hypothetical protein
MQFAASISEPRLTEPMSLASNIFVIHNELVYDTASECDVDVVRTSEYWVEAGKKDVRTSFEVNGRPHCVEQFRELIAERAEALRREIAEEPLFDHCRIAIHFGTDAQKLAV